MLKKLSVALAVVIVLVSLAPFPNHVTNTLYTTDDELTTVLIDMWCLRYVLTENKLLGTVTVATPFSSTRYGEHLNFNGLTPRRMGEEPLYWFSGYRYDTEANTMYPVSLYLTQKFDRVLIREIRDGVPYTTMAGRHNTDAAALQEFFAPYPVG